MSRPAAQRCQPASQPGCAVVPAMHDAGAPGARFGPYRTSPGQAARHAGQRRAAVGDAGGAAVLPAWPAWCAVGAPGPGQHRDHHVEQRRARRAGDRAGGAGQQPAQALAEPPHAPAPRRWCRPGPGAVVRRQSRPAARASWMVANAALKSAGWVSDELAGAHDRAREAGAAHARRVDDLGHEPAGEHERLELQRRVQQPDQAQGPAGASAAGPAEVRSAAHAARPAPSARGAPGRRTARRRERTGCRTQGQPAAGHHPQARSAAEQQHGVAAQRPQAAGQPHQQVGGDSPHAPCRARRSASGPRCRRGSGARRRPPR